MTIKTNMQQNSSSSHRNASTVETAPAIKAPIQSYETYAYSKRYATMPYTDNTAKYSPVGGHLLSVGGCFGERSPKALSQFVQETEREGHPNATILYLSVLILVYGKRGENSDERRMFYFAQFCACIWLVLYYSTFTIFVRLQ